MALSIAVVLVLVLTPLHLQQMLSIGLYLQCLALLRLFLHEAARATYVERSGNLGSPLDHHGFPLL